MTIRLDRDTYERIRERAQRQERSVSYVVRQLCREALDADAGTAQGAAA